jgi:hypothetical protein
MNVTVLYVKCKTKKCGEVIAVDKKIASDETFELQCRRGHAHKYDRSGIQPRTAKAWKGSGLTVWW